MRWQLRAGVLERLPFAERPGSPWWRAVNERILRDGCEAVALSGNLSGPTSSATVDRWTSFVGAPTARAWYGAPGAIVVAAYLEHRDLAEAENEPERFFMNVILCRVLYTLRWSPAPRISLGWLRPLASLLSDPRLGMTGIFLQLSRVLLPSTRPGQRRNVPRRARLRAALGLRSHRPAAATALRMVSRGARRRPAISCVRDGALTYAWALEDQGRVATLQIHSSSGRRIARCRRPDASERQHVRIALGPRRRQVQVSDPPALIGADDPESISPRDDVVGAALRPSAHVLCLEVQRHGALIAVDVHDMVAE